MTNDNSPNKEDSLDLFSDYGQLVLLLDADTDVLREVIIDTSPEQKRDIIDVLEDQINDAYIEGNEDMLKRFLLLWLFTIRMLDADAGVDERTNGFSLNFSEWEHRQFS